MFSNWTTRGGGDECDTLARTNLSSFRSGAYDSTPERLGQMDRDFVVRGLKSNWHLLSLCIGVLAAAFVWAIIEPDTRMNRPVASASTQPDRTGFPSDASVYANRWKRATKDARVTSAIKTYEWELSNNRASEETPSNLYRLGNLYYSNLQNYEKASLYYETLLKDHPDFPGNATVFPNLAACYKRLGNFALERHTYQKMIEFFPPDSQETLFARQELGL